MTALTAHRLHFAFSVVYHYLFPQLTMGLGLLIVVLKILALRGNAFAGEAARFWTRIFALGFVMAAAGAFYLLQGKHVDHAKVFLRVGVTAGIIAAVMMAMPTGDAQARLLAQHQPVTFAAMEGHFHTEDGAGLTLVGQPDVERLRLDNPITVPRALSFMTHQRWDARIEGLTSFDRGLWPDNVALLYYSYHVMVGLGTIFMALLALAAVLLRKGRLFGPRARPVLWALLLGVPLPFVANTAGWMTAELGRQPWLVYGVLRTEHGYSANVTAANALFTLLGFMGIYALLSLLFAFVVHRIFSDGPGPAQAGRAH